MLPDVEVEMELVVVFTLETFTEVLAGVALFPPLLPLPTREGLELAPSKLPPLFALALFPPPLEDKTIFNGGTFSPPPPVDTPGVPSAAFPAPDDFPATFDELSLSSFSASEWSRLWGFLGLFVADADPDDEEGLFLSLLSAAAEIKEPTGPPLPFPVTAFPEELKQRYRISFQLY